MLELFFEGTFKKGKKNGFGVLTKPGYKFEGAFAEDFREGPFEEFFERENKKRIGVYRRDAIVGRIEERSLDKDEKIFEGLLVDGKKQGDCFIEDKE